MEISSTANTNLGESICLIESKNGNKIICVKDGNPIKSFECENDEVVKLI